jgi:hypothetical protein
MDLDYEAAVVSAENERVARGEYESARRGWLLANAPTAVDLEPVHDCLVVSPDAAPFEIEFEELLPGDEVCGARLRGSKLYAFGSASEVITALTRRPREDAWVDAVCTALVRERLWPGGRRSTLFVSAGAGEMFHVTAAVNRDSIARHGLDWHRMGAASGIAGNRNPDLPAIFLCEHLHEVSFFLQMSRVTTDVWAVRVDGLWVENGPDGWMIIQTPIDVERLRLIETDVAPTEFGDIGAADEA